MDIDISAKLIYGFEVENADDIDLDSVLTSYIADFVGAEPDWTIPHTEANDDWLQRHHELTSADDWVGFEWVGVSSAKLVVVCTNLTTRVHFNYLTEIIPEMVRPPHNANIIQARMRRLCELAGTLYRDPKWYLSVSLY